MQAYIHSEINDGYFIYLGFFSATKEVNKEVETHSVKIQLIPETNEIHVLTGVDSKSALTLEVPKLLVHGSKDWNDFKSSLFYAVMTNLECKSVPEAWTNDSFEAGEVLTECITQLQCSFVNIRRHISFKEVAFPVVVRKYDGTFYVIYDTKSELKACSRQIGFVFDMQGTRVTKNSYGVFGTMSRINQKVTKFKSRDEENLLKEIENKKRKIFNTEVWITAFIPGESTSRFSTVSVREMVDEILSSNEKVLGAETLNKDQALKILYETQGIEGMKALGVKLSEEEATALKLNKSERKKIGLV